MALPSDETLCLDNTATSVGGMASPCACTGVRSPNYFLYIRL